jgi:hypothetical protein
MTAKQIVYRATALFVATSVISLFIGSCSPNHAASVIPTSSTSTRPVVEQELYRYGLECGANDIEHKLHDYRSEFKMDPPLASAYIVYQPPPPQKGQAYSAYLSQEFIEQKDEATQNKWLAGFIRGYAEGASQAERHSR